MELEFHIKMNENLYLRDPQETDLGKTILHHSVEQIHEMGFENFTFKKLAEAAGTTEASVYRYFENKHKMLVYIAAWYWNWLHYQINFATNNITEPSAKLRRVIQLLASPVKSKDASSYINKGHLHKVMVDHGLKAYLTKQVTEDNKQQLFKPYKDLCSHIGSIILECNGRYKYPRSLASTLVEMAHLQSFFKDNLPSLTDFGGSQSEEHVIQYLNDMAESCIKYEQGNLGK